MKPLLKPLCRIAALIVLFGAPSAFADESDIEGRWLSGDKSGWIDIRLIDGKPVGTAAGSTTPEEVPCVDEFNPDPALRDRPLLGITILHGFTYEGDGVWKGGTIYEPSKNERPLHAT